MHKTLSDADLAIAQARHAAQTADLLFGALFPPAIRKPAPAPKPRAPRAENTFKFEYEDGIVNFLYDAEVTDWGSVEDAPTCRLLKVLADFGGSTQVEVPLSALSAELTSAIELDASDQVTEQEYEREREAKDRQRGFDALDDFRAEGRL